MTTLRPVPQPPPQRMPGTSGIRRGRQPQRPCKIKRRLTIESVTPDSPVVIATDISIRWPSQYVGCGYLATNGYYGIVAHQQPRAAVGPKATDVAELRAILYALQAQPPGQSVVVLCDSIIAVDYTRSWRNGNMTYPPGYVLSRRRGKSSLQKLAELLRDNPQQTSVQWVRGHAGHPLNEAADYLARLAMDVASRNTDKTTAIGRAGLRLTRALTEFQAQQSASE
jgi:ribonuclease HI